MRCLPINFESPKPPLKRGLYIDLVLVEILKISILVKVQLCRQLKNINLAFLGKSCIF